MRLAVFSDIHGNAIALEAVLRDISKQSVDQMACLGDVASMGPQPAEVMDMLIPLNSIFISGNHDEAMLQPERRNELGISPFVQPDFLWGLERLQASHFEFLKSFQSKVEINVTNEIQLLCCHGSPKSSTDFMHPGTPSDTLNRYFESCPATVIVNGHLHSQFHEIVQGRHMINPGSVGMPFKVPPGPGCPPVMYPWAEYAVISLTNDDSDGKMNVQVELRTVRYRFEKLKEILLSSSLPGKNWWLEQLAQPEFM
ncbi:MAG: metallophosphatase family protein [Candidatus Riflebacteria bacterium]|nr:metallophosphatase family protein [Candidatus Riflebacteria bacterium]